MSLAPSHEAVGLDRSREWIVICDHASNHVPAEVASGDLGLPAEDMARHIAWDPGARGVALALAEALSAPLVASRFSRLVIDPNRGEDDPTLIRKIYDRSIVPGNRAAGAAERARRLDLYYRPYHAAIADAIDAAEGRGGPPRLVSIHSFTAQLAGQAKRPWHLGLLWDRDDRLLRPLQARLAAETHLCVGENQPYSGALPGDCMARHGTSRGLPHILIEIRNDLIATQAHQAQWGRDLARWLRDAA